MSNPPRLLGSEPSLPVEKVAAVQRMLRASLEKSYEGATIVTRTEFGPFGLGVVVASLEHAYPGSGVLRVLLDARGVTYGVHGEKDLAELVRERGWIDTPPEDLGAWARLVNVAQFEGVAILLDEPAPNVVRVDEGLAITLYRTWHPSGGQTRMEITIGARGPAHVIQTNEKRG
jgi:hypothetical protein